MTEPRFILRTRGSRINPAIRASPVTSRSRAIPETAQFVTERTKRAGEKRVVDRLRVAIHAAKRRKSRDIRKFVALVRILLACPTGVSDLEPDALPDDLFERERDMTKRVPIVMALALSLLGLPARGYADERDGRDRDDRSREERSDSRSVKGVALDGAHEVLRVADAALYELSEDAVLSTDEEGKFPVFDPAAAAFRVATSSLQGIAKLGTILCPASMFVTNPKADSCTVTATGLSRASLFTGLGSIRGAVEIVIQLDNPVDSPELPVVKGTFAGTINFIPAFSGTPLGSARGSLTVTVSPLDPSLVGVTVPFTGVFRQPFVISEEGQQKKPRRGADAFYLVDGKPVPVRHDERAAGWPTVRFEITFGQ